VRDAAKIPARGSAPNGLWLCPIHVILAAIALVVVGLAWLSGRRARRLTPTELTRRRYDRAASFYDYAEGILELGFRRWRRELWARVPPGPTLELGIGTGRSLRYYPLGAEVIAIDLSPRMLARARRRAARLGVAVDLRVADVQSLPFPDASFETVLATCLFCSVPEPVSGLREARRVLKPGGRLLLIEHVRSRRPLLGRLMAWLDPLVVRIWGAHIARDTVSNVRAAGFVDMSVDDLALDVVKRIVAVKAGSAESRSMDTGPGRPLPFQMAKSAG
jgi:phosphatidylethanolamine/phosphatidyl-N-methylethanolamine N-methyltransferase